MLDKKKAIPGIKQVILVAAGKGGVGKSTVSCLLAKQLVAKNFQVGILDADIYGPSIPTIMNIEGTLPEIENGMFIPVKANDISIMSIGFLVKKESALAWRGPMLSKALNQLLFSTKWDELDYLIIDMPPGTGDIHISIIHKCAIEGVIIVSTPDKVAISDVERAIDLYQKMNVALLGIVENMSYIQVNEKNIFPFGKNGIEEMAKKLNIKLMAKLPLIPELAENHELYNSESLQIEFE